MRPWPEARSWRKRYAEWGMRSPGRRRILERPDRIAGRGLIIKIGRRKRSMSISARYSSYNVKYRG